MTTQPPFMRIGDAAKLVGVAPHVLRYWETEFPYVKPKKNRGGQRVYNRKQVERLITIRRLLHDQGYTIKGARNALTRRRQAHKPWPPTPGLSDEEREALGQIRRLTVLMLDAHDAILSGRIDEALAAINEGLFKEPPLDLSAATTTEEDIREEMRGSMTEQERQSLRRQLG